MIVDQWQVVPGGAATADFAAIMRWTKRQFGPDQEARYRRTVLLAIGELMAGPLPLGSRARDDVAPGLRILHVGRHGRRGRHFLLYRTGEGQRIEIIRILHDAMDLPRHLTD